MGEEVQCSEVVGVAEAVEAKAHVAGEEQGMGVHEGEVEVGSSEVAHVRAEAEAVRGQWGQTHCRNCHLHHAHVSREVQEEGV